ncbi:RDD family protein [Paraglaciecola sp.]|uniref:RDD family protein n=1 Tax=Paraglaciecola sp. TaxID=1920173 RepID=UPI003266A74B
MSDNLFTPPESNLIDEINEQTTSVLASRWSRLGASLVDSFIMMLFVIPIMYFVGWFEIISSGEEPSHLYTLGFGILGIVFFVFINLKLLVSHGQTVGKKVLKIKIVDLNDDKAELKKHLLKRYGIYFIPNQVPFLGGIFQFINILFIFRKDKRCIHDLVAGTQVVYC